jgi:hypothetical protein
MSLSPTVFWTATAPVDMFVASTSRKHLNYRPKAQIIVVDPAEKKRRCAPLTLFLSHFHAVVPGVFPRAGRGLLGECAFDTRGHGHALLLQGRSTLGTELSTAWASARGQLKAVLQVRQRAAARRGASEHGRRSKRRREKQGVGRTRRSSSSRLTGQNADQGAVSDPDQKRLLELNVQAVGSALGFGTLAPGAGTPSTRTHSRNRMREAQGPLGTGESGAATGQR